MQRRLPRTALATLLTTFAMLGGQHALAHDAPGSTSYVVPVPSYVFSGEAYVDFPIFGPPAAEEILHATLDLTFVAPAGQMLGSDVVIEIDFPLTSGTLTWVIHGHELGWPAASGTFEAHLDTDAFNGVLDGPPGGITLIKQRIGSETGSTWGHFMGSTLTLELAGEVCQADLGFGGPGQVSLSMCGQALASGGTSTLSVVGAPAFAPVFVVASLGFAPTPFKGGTLVPLPLQLMLSFAADGSGSVAAPLHGGNGPLTIYVQAVASDGGQVHGYAFSNALQVELLP